MKYFTNKWFDENTSDDELNTIRDSYWESIKKISNKFSNQLFTLAFNTNLHDGIIFKVIIWESNSTIDLLIRIGDLQNGYEDLQIKYFNAAIDKSIEVMLKDIINDEDLEILYDEISIKGKDFAHSFLFSNHNEIAIVFSSLEITKKKVVDRSIGQKEFINKRT